jgi:NADH:ubiquinone oxidoreductase subunit 6 (subunit J)
MEQKITPSWTKGLIISLLLIVYGLFLYFTGQQQNRTLGMLQLVILIAGMIVACIGYSKQMNGNLTFGNLFAHGFKATATVIVIMSLYTILATKVLFPDMVDQAMNQARVEMEKKGTLTDEQISQGMALGRKFFVPFAIGGIILSFGIIGAIGSLIGAGVAKKNPNYNPLEQ